MRIDEWRRQYGLNFLVANNTRRLSFSMSSVSSPDSNNLAILTLSWFIIVQSASGLIGAPVFRLQISLASGVLRKGCSFSQSLT